MQNKIMELNIDELKKDDFDVSDLDIEVLKMKLVERKVRKAITRLENGDYYLDDTEINYLNDCLNLPFLESSFSYQDLALVMNVNKLPKDNTIELDTINKVSLNGILDYNQEDIIVVEPLKYQMEKVVRLDTLDTRFKEDISLSEKAVILINYDNSLDTSLYNNNKVLRYKGNLLKILEKILLLLEFKPQGITEKGFVNQDNNKLLHNYIMQEYPSKLSVDVLESLEERQNKELSTRDEILSIIRNGVILMLDDIDITANELVLLAEHYKNIHAPESKDLNKLDFTDFVNIYGVRVSEDGIYLIDEENIASRGYADNETIDYLYNIYLKTKKNYKDRLTFLKQRKSILSSIYESDYELNDKREISDTDLDLLYKAYQEIENFDFSVKKFMQDVGVRVNENHIYLLSDDETINLLEFVNPTEEDKIALFLRDGFGEECFTENEKNFGISIKENNHINLSFEGLEDFGDYFAK